MNSALTDPTIAALHAAVLADPSDDVRRLAYADRLREAGDDDRAEFVAVQVELNRLWDDGCGCQPGETCPRCERIDALRARERELWGSYPGTDDVRSYFHAVMPAAPGGWVILPASEAHHGGGGHPFAVVSRGFVSAVAAPLAVLFGGPCPRCVTTASGYRLRHDNPDCPACEGNGSVPGLAPALFGCQPVTEVRLTDREPREVSDSLGDGWTWSRATSRPPDRHAIPDELRRLLPHRDTMPGPRQRGYVRWPTRELALAALSAACVALGRSVADGRTHEVRCETCKGEGHYYHRVQAGRDAAGVPKWSPYKFDCSTCRGLGTRAAPGLPPL